MLKILSTDTFEQGCQPLKYLISCKLHEGGNKLNSYVTFKYSLMSSQVYQNKTRIITVIISLVIPSRLTPC